LDIEAASGAFLGFTVAPDNHIAGTSAGTAFEIMDGVAANYTVNCGFLNIANGGTVTGVTVNTGASLLVISGGTATEIRENGGYINIEDGAIVTFAANSFSGLVLLHSSASIHSGTTATETTVNYFGNLHVFNGGTATDTTVNEDGSVWIDGVATGITVNEGGSITVCRDGTATGIRENGGFAFVEEGADVAFVPNAFEGLLLEDASATIHSGTTVTGTTVNEYGALYVYDGGTATGAIVNEDGLLEVHSDGTASEIQENGGFVSVEEGANATFVSNTFSGLVLSSASATVHSGTTAAETTLNRFGDLYVYDGGTANSTTINSYGNLYVYSGTATGATVNTFGSICVYGGTATAATVNLGGRLMIDSDGTATEIVENGGFVSVEEGTATFASNTFSGLDIGKSSATVHSGTTAVETTIQGGRLFVYSGGLAKDTVISLGELNISSGGTADGVTINRGFLLIESGGTALNAILKEKGNIRISSGGTANNTIVNEGGNMEVKATGIVDTATINKDGRLYLSSGGTANNTTVNSGASLFISSGATLNNTTINKIVVKVSSGVTVNGTTVNEGGKLEVSRGGTTNNTEINSGGHMNVNFGGIANSTTARESASITVSSGGTANNTTVQYGGWGYIRNGGSANSATVHSSGWLYVSSGGVLTGQMTFEKGAGVIANGAAFIDFDISRITADAGARLSDFSLIQGTPTYTLTVSDSPVNGIYKLAENASTFRSTILVRSTEKELLGTLSVGQTLTIGEIGYTLNLEGSSLTVMVTGGSSGGYVFTGELTNKTKDITSGWSAVNVTVRSSGQLNISSGGIASNTYVYSKGGITVFDGGIASQTHAQSGTVQVYSGGRVVSTVVLGNRGSGAIHVFSGGVADSTSINIGGSMFVSSGGTANETWISQSGGLTVLSGGVANSTMVRGSMSVSGGTADGLRLYYGRVMVSSGGKLTGRMVLLDGTVSVDSSSVVDFDLTQTLPGAAARITDLSIISGAQNFTVTVGANQSEGLYLLAEGADTFDKSITVVNTAGDALGTISAGTTIDISGTSYKLDLSDGALSLRIGTEDTPSPYTSNGLIISYGAKTVYDGELYYDTFVNAGGIHVSSGGIASKTRLETEGRMFVSSGGYVENTEDVSYVRVESGGTAVRTSVGASMYIASGGTALNITEYGGCVTIEDGATVTFAPNVFNDLYVTRDYYSSVTVHSGTTANRIVVYYEGNLCVYDGGVANDCIFTRLNTGRAGYLYVYSGGTANRTRLDSGGTMYVLSGGTANETIVVPFDQYVYSGVMHVSGGGIANNTEINSRGSMYVYSGGTANGTTVNYNGSMHVLSGGTANETTVSYRCSMFVFGGTANDTTVSSGGSMFVSGGTANGTTVNASCRIIISHGGTANSTTVSSGGSMFVHFDATANKTTVYSGGSMHVSNGVANGISVGKGGWLTATGGATATDISAASGALLGFTVAPDTFIAGTSAGSAFEIRDGVASQYTVASGGRLHVSSGGTANDTTVKENGALYVHSGGTATGIAAVSGAFLGFTVAPDTFIAGTSAGSAFEIRDGAASGYTINNGSLEVTSGGLANSTTVNEDGSIRVSSGGLANSTTVNEGGSIRVSSGGLANSTTLNEGGGIHLHSDGTATDTTVNASGSFYVYDGGVANGATVGADGNLSVSSGGTITGKMLFADGAVVSMEEEAILDFDLAQASAGANPLLNDLSIIQGTPLYWLTVDAEWKPGTHEYMLAGGAAEFTGTINVVNKDGESFGALAVGETVKVGYNSYTLSLADSVLSVTAVVPDLTPQAPVGTADKVSWDTTGANEYIVEYSTDNFEHVVQVVTTASATDMLELPAGTYQWRVKADANSEWAVGEPIVSEPESDTPKVVQSNEDGNDDLFFASPFGTWDDCSFALHTGSVNDWGGTKELVAAEGRGRIRNLFFGSADPNVLCLTDAENGDAIFVDDIYTDSPDDMAKETSRLYKIQEIRAGAGDDIVDMTSNRFEYTGDGLTIRGGDGDDVIWANKGNNLLFGDAGDDRIVGASGSDVIAGGIGDDSMHGGGGNDVFVFCGNWGADTVRQLETGTVTLWFADGDGSNWDDETLTYTDGENSVTVSGVTAEQITLKFGENSPEDAAQYAALSGMGAFADFTSQKIFEESGAGLLSNA
jgi:autotransporter passenger strand-loop-strand repeat protein